MGVPVRTCRVAAAHLSASAACTPAWRLVLRHLDVGLSSPSPEQKAGTRKARCDSSCTDSREPRRPLYWHWLGLRGGLIRSLPAGDLSQHSLGTELHEPFFEQRFGVGEFGPAEHVVVVVVGHRKGLLGHRVDAQPSWPPLACSAADGFLSAAPGRAGRQSAIRQSIDAASASTQPQTIRQKRPNSDRSRALTPD